MRSMFYTVAADSIKDTGRGGPMAEYERRIASGELVDGDSFQVLLWSLTKGSFLG
jgi:protein AFG1